MLQLKQFHYGTYNLDVYPAYHPNPRTGKLSILVLSREQVHPNKREQGNHIPTNISKVPAGFLDICSQKIGYTIRTYTNSPCKKTWKKQDSPTIHYLSMEVVLQIPC